MKKLIIGLFAALLMATGFVSFTSTSASAACPYTGCIDTDVKIISSSDSIDRGTAPSFKVKVTTDGNPKPKGTIKIVCTKPKTKRSGARYASVSYDYNGGTKTFDGPVLRKVGRWTCTVKFIPNGGSVYARSSSSTKVRVHR
jgi:hypothetical protein